MSLTHKELLYAIADGKTILYKNKAKAAGEYYQLDGEYTCARWLVSVLTNSTSFSNRNPYDEFDFIIKPDTIKIGEYDVPEPYYGALKVGVPYYVVSLTSIPGYFKMVLKDSERTRLQRQIIEAQKLGQFHLSEENAALHYEALVSFTKK